MVQYYARSGTGTRLHVFTTDASRALCGRPPLLGTEREAPHDEPLCKRCEEIQRQRSLTTPQSYVAAPPSQPAESGRSDSDRGCLIEGLLGLIILVTISALGIGPIVVLGGIAFALWKMGPPGRAYLALMFVVFGIPLLVQAAGQQGAAEALMFIFGVIFLFASFSGGGWAGSDRGAQDSFDGS